MPDFNDIPTGLRVPTQIPLDVKAYFPTIASLQDLGDAENKVFTYYKGFRAYCVETDEIYVWREALPEYGAGLLPSNFTYPAGTVCYGVDYSNKEYNFFLKPDYLEQNNFVRRMIINEDNLPEDYTVQDICDYILALPAASRTIAETDSKWNIIIGEIAGEEPDTYLMINFIYEIQNKGKGIITTLTPKNLLLIERRLYESEVKEEVIYFTRQQVLNYGYRLIHNLNVVRYLAEHFSYSNEMFNQNDIATFTPQEMIDRGIIGGYNYINPNQIELQEFINYKPFISNTDVLAYYVRYIGGEGPETETINIPNKFLTYHYNSSLTPSENSRYIPYNQVLGGLYTTYGLSITQIRITQLPATAELYLNGNPLSVGDVVSVYDLNNELFNIYLDKFDGTGPDGDYSDSFKFIAIDSDLNESNEVDFIFTAIDENIGLTYTADSPVTININYNSQTGLQNDQYVSLFSADLLQNVVNSLGNNTVAIQLESLPTIGELIDHAWLCPVGYNVPSSSLLGNFEIACCNQDGSATSNGNFTTSFTFYAVDEDGNLSNLVTVIINATDLADTEYYSELKWTDTLTSEDRSGESGIGNIDITLAGSTVPVTDSIVSENWQKNSVNGWVDLAIVGGPTYITDSDLGLNQYRVKHLTNLGVTFYSNILNYNATSEGDGSSSSSGTGGSGSGTSGGSGPESSGGLGSDDGSDPSDGSGGGGSDDGWDYDYGS